MHEVVLKRSGSSDSDFQKLIADLDKDLWIRYPLTQQNFAPFNTTNEDARVVLAYIEKEAVACGCFRPGAEGIVEIKRMYVEPVWRGNRIGSLVLGELERWALEEGNRMSRLETGSNQPEAIAVYERSGYKRIPNYPPYDAINESICMAKEIH